MSLWQTHELSPGRYRIHQIGELRVLILRTEDEWQIAHTRSDLNLAPEGELTELAGFPEWKRWQSVDPSHRYSLRPALPELPVLALPRAPFYLLPGTESTFYIGIPLTLEVNTGEGKNLRTLLSIPSRELPKTWHGEISNGEMCWSLDTLVRRRLCDEIACEHSIICPIDMRNRLSQSFEFKEILFDTSSITVYQSGQQLWANRCLIKPEASLSAGEVVVQQGPPKEIISAEHQVVKSCTRPRKPAIHRIFGGFGLVNLILG